MLRPPPLTATLARSAMYDFVRLGNHVSIAKGKPPALIPFGGVGSATYLTPEYLRCRAGAISAKPGRDAVIVADDDAVLLWDGSNAGEVFFGRVGLAASTMARVRGDASFDRRYLVHALKQLEPQIKGQTVGTGIPDVDGKVLGGLRVFRPEPNEQMQVARALDTLDAAIRQTEAMIEKLKLVKQGLLHDLLTRGIDDNGELRPPQSEAPHLNKASALGWIPVDWSSGTLAGWLDERPKNGYSRQESEGWTGSQMLGLGCLTTSGFFPCQLKYAPHYPPGAHGPAWIIRGGQFHADGEQLHYPPAVTQAPQPACPRSPGSCPRSDWNGCPRSVECAAGQQGV